jgi:anti-anti-sigma factor
MDGDPLKGLDCGRAYVTAVIAVGSAIVLGFALGSLLFLRSYMVMRWGEVTIYVVAATLLLSQVLALSLAGRAIRRMRIGLEERQRRIEAWAPVDQQRTQIAAELEQCITQVTHLRTLIVTLSTPLIPVDEQVVIVPLVGTIDAERVQHVRQNLLQGIEQQRARVALVDLTGVAEIAVGATRLFLQLVSAVELMGCRVVLTGINSQIARTFLERGYELPADTHRNVKAGLAYARTLVVQGISSTEAYGRS